MKARIWRKCYRWSVQVMWFWLIDGISSSVRRRYLSTLKRRMVVLLQNVQIQFRVTSSIITSQSVSMHPSLTDFTWWERNILKSSTAGICAIFVLNRVFLHCSAYKSWILFDSVLFVFIVLQFPYLLFMFSKICSCLLPTFCVRKTTYNTFL